MRPRLTGGSSNARLSRWAPPTHRLKVAPSSRLVRAAAILGLVSVGRLAAQSESAILIDRRLTMPVGVSSLLLLESLVWRAEDAVLPRRLGPAGRENRVLGIGYRAAGLVLLDAPTSLFSSVALHEIFGHGARVREFRWSASYHLDWPAPYGAGGGVTETDFGVGTTVTATELLALTAGGMEADNLTGTALGRRWAALNRITYREALRYLFSQADQFGYLHGSPLGEGDDVEAYLASLNGIRAAAGQPALGRSDLARQSDVGLLNPLLWYSFASVLSSHLVSGTDTGRIPMLKLGTLRYLPYLRYSLSPFGPEVHSEHLIRGGERLLSADLRIGVGGGSRTWGFGASLSKLISRPRFELDGRVSVWHQPGFSLGGRTERPFKGGMGGLASVTGRWHTTGASLFQLPIAVVAEVGYKARGFLEGEALGGGAIVRIGMGLIER